MTVDHLKNEIFKEISVALKEVDARQLKLYKFEIKLSDENNLSF